MPARKIIITGTSCTGKTTLGAKLSKQLGLKQIDLDDLHFLPNWQMKAPQVFIADVQTAIADKDEWIISGGYQSKLKDNIWAEANIIIWLDLPLKTVLSRYFRRTYRRIVHKELCCGENYETLSHVLFKENMLLHIFKTYSARKRRLVDWRTTVFPEKLWIVPTTEKEVEKSMNHPAINFDAMT